jgi:Methionyl-tRNA formyltransferase
MKVLIAGNFLESLVDALSEFDDELVTIPNRKLTRDYIEKSNFELAIFHLFDPIVNPDVLNSIRCINIHFSILPYGRGPEPLLASWVNGEPIGVTIHEMTSDLDRGPIIVQTEYPMNAENTSFESSFDFLLEASSELLKAWWETIKKNTYVPKEQTEGGSSHSYRQIEPIFDLVVKYRDLTVSELLKEIERKHPNFKLNNLS